MKSEAEVDLYVFKWHFGFRVANLWLIIVGGSLINQLDPFIDDPGSIVDLLGVSVPGKSQVCFTNTTYSMVVLVLFFLFFLVLCLQACLPALLLACLPALLGASSNAACC